MEESVTEKLTMHIDQVVFPWGEVVKTPCDIAMEYLKHHMYIAIRKEIDL